MRNLKRRTEAEKLEMIKQCRASGLSDSQWCRLHGIPPSTMYTWINRFREKGYPEVPAKDVHETTVLVSPQEVVKLDFDYDPLERIKPQNTPTMRGIEQQNTPVYASDEHQIAHIYETNNEKLLNHSEAMLEIKTANATFKIGNGINPELLKVLVTSITGGVL